MEGRFLSLHRRTQGGSVFGSGRARLPPSGGALRLGGSLALPVKQPVPGGGVQLGGSLALPHQPLATLPYGAPAEMATVASWIFFTSLAGSGRRRAWATLSPM